MGIRPSSDKLRDAEMGIPQPLWLTYLTVKRIAKKLPSSPARPQGASLGARLFAGDILLGAKSGRELSRCRVGANIECTRKPTMLQQHQEIVTTTLF